MDSRTSVAQALRFAKRSINNVTLKGQEDIENATTECNIQLSTLLSQLGVYKLVPLDSDIKEARSLLQSKPSFGVEEEMDNYLKREAAQAEYVELLENVKIDVLDRVAQIFNEQDAVAGFLKSALDDDLAAVEPFLLLSEGIFFDSKNDVQRLPSSPRNKRSVPQVKNS